MRLDGASISTIAITPHEDEEEVAEGEELAEGETAETEESGAEPTETVEE